MCLMKSQAYRPSVDRIITPNASSQHFKGHFIPEPTTHKASHQSRWPDLNQVLPPGFCNVPHPQLHLTSEESTTSESMLYKIRGIKLQQQHVQTGFLSMSHIVLKKRAKTRWENMQKCRNILSMELHIACHQLGGPVI